MAPATEELLGEALRRVLATSTACHPQWGPIRRFLPASWLVGFMWMTSIDGPEGKICVYKHGMTRSTLNLDSYGNAFERLADGSFARSSLTAMLGLWLLDLAALGRDPSTPYDNKRVGEIQRSLRMLGLRVVAQRSHWSL